MLQNRKEEIQLNLKQIKQSLGSSNAQLIAVSKTKPNIDIQACYDCGQLDFGENKVQDLLQKSIDLEKSCPSIQWHFIGSLQSNKINNLLKVRNLVSIHSIDSIQLLNKLLSKSIDNNIGVFLQVNTSEEEQKGGFLSQEILEEAIALLKNHPKFFFQGFMTIGKIRTENFEEDAHKCFKKLMDLKADISQKLSLNGMELSMGMSSDYVIALEYGTKWVRVGSRIFGSRS